MGKARETDALVRLSNALGLAGFRLSHVRAYSYEFTKDDNILYVKTTKKLSIVVNPRKFGSGSTIYGIRGDESFNSNFAAFPEKMHGGKRPENYGIAFDLGSETDAAEFLRNAGLTR